MGGSWGFGDLTGILQQGRKSDSDPRALGKWGAPRAAREEWRPLLLVLDLLAFEQTLSLPMECAYRADVISPGASARAPGTGWVPICPFTHSLTHSFTHSITMDRDSEGQGSLVCCSLWGRKESDTT